MKGALRKRPMVIVTYAIIVAIIVLSLLSIYSQIDLIVPRLQCQQQKRVSDNNDEISLNSSAISGHQNDVIHLASVCGGFNSTNSLYVLLKSIFLYRSSPIELHLFVDNVSLIILKKLFETWTVQDLKINYYNITNYEPEISWIISHHYSRRFGLTKLIVPSVLANLEDISKFMMLDSDMLALGDIREAWDSFPPSRPQHSDKAAIFGLVENQSDWYLSNNQLSRGRIVWPALGRGFNTGIIMVNLLEFRKIDWRQLWRQVTEDELISHLSTSLADQDIYNAIMRSNNHMVHRLSPCFNIQLNDNTNLSSICTETRGLKIIHWNSPYKLKSQNLQADHYKNWYYMFANIDGNLLRSNLRAETTKEKPHEDELNTVCQNIRPRPGDVLTTYLYYREFELDPRPFDITLVVHLSLDRIQNLEYIAANWDGPMSVAIYMLEAETQSLNELIETSENLMNRKNIGLHLVFKNHGFNYPINRLRNLAMDNAMTPYVYLSDIDFVPSHNMYAYLRKMIEDMSSSNDINPLERKALVIPAFESTQYKFEFPANKVELLSQLNLGSVSIFRDQIWPQGQASTDYAKWRPSTIPYKVAWTPDYEPFIVTSRDIPRFDERFVGFGWNKVEHITQLAASGYEFIVMPEAFIIHRFHSASYDITKHRVSQEYKICIRHTRITFLSELRSKHPEFFKGYPRQLD